MPRKFDIDTFSAWQKLIESWDLLERGLAELEENPARLGPSERERCQYLRESLTRLKGEIDEMVLRMSKTRDPHATEAVVALIDAKPEQETFSAMVRQRLARFEKKR